MPSLKINPDKHKSMIELLLIFIFLLRKDFHDVALPGANPHRKEKDLIRVAETLA